MRDHMESSSDWTCKILPLRDQARITNQWLRVRLDEIMPQLMARESIDMWIVTAREYNEDPVLMTLLPAPALSARRRTMLVFARRPDGGVDRLAIDRLSDPRGDYYTVLLPQEGEDQWACLGRVVREYDPQSIGINCSETFAFGDGLTHTEHQRLGDALDPLYRDRIVRAEKLAVSWLEKRSGPELEAYAGIVAIAHGIIDHAFSGRVIHPGVTTTLDVGWWIRQRIQDLGLRAWFHPSVSIQRRGMQGFDHQAVIAPGDLLHCDVGLHYLGLATDTQRHAYVLPPGEDDAPKGLKSALVTGNRLQDILASQFVEGRTGNEILAMALERARGQGIRASIYTHPIGFHGHGAGPTIGLWDNQDGVPGRGDYPLFNDTCHAMELNVVISVPEWEGQDVRIALEQDVLFSGDKVHFLAGRQKQFYLIT